MTYRHRTPGKKELRQQHLMRLALVADRVTNGVPTEGFKLAIRICRNAGCSLEEMASCCNFSVDQLREWSE